VTNTVIAENPVSKVLYGMQIAYGNALQADIQASNVLLATYPDNLRLFAVADSNGDGGSDFLWQDRSTNEVVLWTRDGTTIKSKTVVASPAVGFTAVAAYDVAADGSSADIVLVNPATATLRVVTMGDAVASSTTDLIMPSGVWRPVPFPFIANSVLIRHPQTGELRRITMPGRGLASRTIAVGSPPANYEIQAIGDLDGDGQPDIVARSGDDDQVRFYMMNGNNISQVCTGLCTAHWNVQGMHDWDGNGVNDLLVSEAGGDHRVVVLYMEVKTYANGSISIPQIKSNQVLGALGVGEVVGLGVR
ncbi:MAG: VCBS repeat-containing protein, partial [Phycisphaerae bacterium]